MGTQLNKHIRSYQLVERIGKGGFGEVYRAYQSTVGREVAIKVIMPQYANHPDFIRNFETEAKMVARLEHPFIVPLFDYWREPSGAYIVMRYLRGGTLKDEMADGAMSPHRVADILDNLCSTLWTAHRNRVAHRDIKPANIMMDDERRAYLSDFGLAITVGDDHYDHLVGTWLYMPPERIQTQKQTHTVDVYSLGIMTYQMLAGDYPFDRTTMQRLAQSHIKQILPPIEDYRHDVSPELNAVFQRATSKDPEARYEDIRVFAQIFRQIVQPLGTVGDVTEVLTIYEEVMNPYMGLRPFLEADSEFFFGRTTLVEKLIERINEDTHLANFLALVGPSGSGKSSVIYAGLIPQLKAGIIEGSDQWYFAHMMPGAHPFQNLLLALRSVAAINVEDVTEQMKADPDALLKLVPKLLENPDATLLLFIDQFEEVFTQVSDELIRQEFLDLIVTTVTDPNTRVRIIITMRADFYDRPLRYEMFGKLMQARTEVILPLDTSELERVITGPARQVGVAVETDLVAEIISDVKSEPGALPLLQYTLTELFSYADDKLLTLEEYRESGGLRASLARRADTVYQSLSDELKDVARIVFLRLVTIGEGTEDTRRRARFSELLALNSDGSLVQQVMDEFSQYRLLTFDRDPETREPTAEVAHEALIREWKQFRHWLDASRDELRLQRMIDTEVADWMENNQDSSYLLRGNRLSQVQHWAESTNFGVSTTELEYIQASLVEQERVEKEERAHIELELKLMKQNSRRLRFIVALLLILSVGGIFLLGNTIASEQEAREAEEEAHIAELAAESAKATAESNLSRAYSSQLITIAQQAYSDGDFGLAVAFAMKALERDGESEVAYNTLTEIAYGPGIRRIIEGDGQRVHEVIMSHNGNMVIGLSGFTYTDVIRYMDSLTETPSQEVPDFSTIDFDELPSSGVNIWDVQTGEFKIRFTGHTSVVTSVGFIPALDAMTSPTLAYSASILGEVFIWDITSGDIIQTLERLPQGHNRLSITRDGKFILGTSGSSFDTDEDRLVLWDVETGEIIKRFELAAEKIWDSSISGDGRYAVSAYLDHTQVAWDVETGETLAEFDIDDQIIEPQYRTIISDDASTVATSIGSGEVYIWEFLDGFQRAETKPGSIVFDIALSGDGSLVLILQPKGEFYEWDVPTKELWGPLENRGVALLSASYDFQGDSAAVGRDDGSIVIWDLADSSPDLARSFREFESNMRAAFLPTDDDTDVQNLLVFDGEEATNSAITSTLSIWNIDTGVRLDQWDTPHTLSPQKVIVDDSGQYAVTIAFRDLGAPRLNNDPQQFIVWDILNQTILHAIEPEFPIVDAEFVYDGDTLMILTNWDNGVALWDVVTGDMVRTFDAGVGVLNVKASDDLRYIFATTRDGQLIQWGYDTGDIITTYDLGQNSQILEIWGDDSLVVTGYKNRDVAVWNYEKLDTQQPQAILRGHSSKPTSALLTNTAVADYATSEDFLMLVTSAGDGSVIYWDMETNESIGIVSYNSRIVEMVLSPDSIYHTIVSDVGALDVVYVVPSDEDIMQFVRENRMMNDITLQDCVQYNAEQVCKDVDLLDNES